MSEQNLDELKQRLNTPKPLWSSGVFNAST